MEVEDIHLLALQLESTEVSNLVMVFADEVAQHECEVSGWLVPLVVVLDSNLSWVLDVVDGLEAPLVVEDNPSWALGVVVALLGQLVVDVVEAHIEAAAGACSEVVGDRCGAVEECGLVGAAQQL